MTDKPSFPVPVNTKNVLLENRHVKCPQRGRAPRSIASPVGKVDGAKHQRWKLSFKYVCKDLFLPLVQLPNLPFYWTPLHNECNIGIHRIPESSSFPPQKYVMWRVKKLERKTQNILVTTAAVVEHISHRAILFRIHFCQDSSLGPQSPLAGIFTEVGVLPTINHNCCCWHLPCYKLVSERKAELSSFLMLSSR